MGRSNETQVEKPEKMVRLKALKCISRMKPGMEDTPQDEREYAPGAVFECTEKESAKWLKARKTTYEPKRTLDEGTVSWHKHEAPYAEVTRDRISTLDEIRELYHKEQRRRREEAAAKIKAEIERNL